MSYDSPLQVHFGMARSHKSLPTPLTRPVRTSYLQGVDEEDTADVPTLDTIHDWQVTNIVATKVQQQINRDATEVEKSKKFLKELNQPAFIAWLSGFRVCKQRKGYQNLIFGKFLQSVVANSPWQIFYFLRIISLSYLEAKFDLSDAHSYSKCLEALFVNPKAFLRADVQII